jgi:hypothetical protein
MILKISVSGFTYHLCRKFRMMMNSNFMTVKLSRQGIYDLVWSKPLMHAAKELGLTGVKLPLREHHRSEKAQSKQL